MTCTSACRKANGRQAHCGTCHHTFSTVAVFDHHRVGLADVRRCVEPAERGMHLDRVGVWRRDGRAPHSNAPSGVHREPRGGETGSGVVRDTPVVSEAAETISGGSA